MIEQHNLLDPADTFFYISSITKKWFEKLLKNLKFGMVINWPNFCCCRYKVFFLQTEKWGLEDLSLKSDSGKIINQSNILRFF